ncbi:MAG TPA: DUF4230 domain-containing protein [Gemmatimonadales bacterium]|nr:DUF4230 domain-containing protein [Gemmatimonadales bacterium]
MTGPPPTAERSRRRWIPALIVGGLLLVVAAHTAALLAARLGSAIGKAAGSGTTRVTQAVVVEKMRAVARLVTSETTVRDVVTYENRRLGSTKRSLVVVTGRVLTGFDLDRGTEVAVDHDSRLIRVVLPPAAVLGVEVTELRTYDERSGLWNPFRPSDRDTIFRLAREQLVKAAGDMEMRAHAEESARRLLEAMVNTDGYRTEVTFRGGAARAD